MFGAIIKRSPREDLAILDQEIEHLSFKEYELTRRLSSVRTHEVQGVSEDLTQTRTRRNLLNFERLILLEMIVRHESRFRRDRSQLPSVWDRLLEDDDSV